MYTNFIYILLTISSFSWSQKDTSRSHFCGTADLANKIERQKQIYNSSGSQTLTVTTTADNTQGHIVNIDHALLNENPDAFIIVSQLYGKYNQNAIGVWYNEFNKRWTIFNQNKQKLPIGTQFNVLIVDKSQVKSAFVHKATKSNTNVHMSVMKSELINKFQDPIIIVTQRYGVHNPSPVGVRPMQGKWHVYNTDKSQIPDGTMFNVLVFEKGQLANGEIKGVTFKTKTRAANTDLHILKLAQGKAKDENTMCFFTQQLLSHYQSDPQGVWWNGTEWTIFNQTWNKLNYELQYHVLMIEPIVKEVYIPHVPGMYTQYDLNLPRIDAYAEGAIDGYKSNKILPLYNQGFAFEYAVKDNEAIFEGDIVLGSANDVVAPRPPGHPQRPNFHNLYNNNKDGIGSATSPLLATNSEECLWFYGIIPYEFDTDWTSQEKLELTSAIEILDKLTNLTLTPRNGQEDYIYFKKVPDLNGGSSPVGRTGGRNTIKLGGTWEGTVIHEILHSAGFWHEQGRSDRDEHVEVLIDNVKFGKKHNFNMHYYDAIKIGPYDKNSIMHYGGFVFSKEDEHGHPLPTILDKSTGKAIARKNSLSIGDIAGINFLYPENFSRFKTPDIDALRTLKANIISYKVTSGEDNCGEVEFYASARIGEGFWFDSMLENVEKYETGQVDGPIGNPNWSFNHAISKGTSKAKIVFLMKEIDGGLCFADDFCDINPINGTLPLNLHIYLESGQIYVIGKEGDTTSHYLGQVGEEIELEGFDRKDSSGDDTILTQIKFKIDLL